MATEKSSRNTLSSELADDAPSLATLMAISEVSKVSRKKRDEDTNMNETEKHLVKLLLAEREWTLTTLDLAIYALKCGIDKLQDEEALAFTLNAYEKAVSTLKQMNDTTNMYLQLVENR
jgi:hypothetical protein